MTTPSVRGPWLRHRAPVLVLLIANVVSLIGNMLAWVAIPWFVLETTGSAAKTGITGFFTILPTVIAAFFGGALVDRLGHKRASIVADLLSGVTVALIPLLDHTVGLAFWQLLALVFLGALFDAPGATARMALFPDLVERAGMPLERANAAYQGMQRLAQLLGPILAGVLIVALGPSNVLWLDAASFAISAALVTIAVPALVVATEPDAAQGRYWDELRAGVRFIAGHPLFRALMLVIVVTNFLDAAMGTVVLPVLADELYGNARALGLLYAALGAGAVISSIIFGMIGHRLPRRETFIASFVLAGLPIWVLAMSPPLALAVGMRFLIGLGAGPLNPILMTLFQEQVPPAMRGRVFGASTALVTSAAPLGAIIAGYLIESWSLRLVLLAIAGCYLLATTSMAFTPAIRALSAAKPAPLPHESLTGP